MSQSEQQTTKRKLTDIPTSELETMGHSDLLALRYSTSNKEEQEYIAPYEHRAFAREYVTENPATGPLAMAISIPGYQIAKAVGATATDERSTGVSGEQVVQGFKGVAEGIEKNLEPWKMRWEELKAFVNPKEGQERREPSKRLQKPAEVKINKNPWEMSPSELKGVRVPGKAPVEEFDMKGYLASLESTESSGNPNAKASTTTAEGLHQFTAGTWMETVNKMGKDYTLSDRTDPAKSKEVAEFLTKTNIEKAKKDLGRAPTKVEAYMYHFLGNAKKFLTAPEDDDAVEYVTKSAVKNNKSVFYTKDGEKRSVGEVLALYKKKFGEK